ncbi:hypothetical protein DPMN_153365 [Dreissena polymorpha]|uniref:Uncharacterized protein n=1 Tax=Dreissena polymorpha TaxID=45954 RepID=A0A9D4FN28_DREPO|nr:hypothetical protein DPMN_153365 [Dreissena polymorpha]
MDELQEAFDNFNIQDRKRIIRRMLLRWHPDRIQIMKNIRSVSFFPFRTAFLDSNVANNLIYNRSRICQTCAVRDTGTFA